MAIWGDDVWSGIQVDLTFNQDEEVSHSSNIAQKFSPKRRGCYYCNMTDPS